MLLITRVDSSIDVYMSGRVNNERWWRMLSVHFSIISEPALLFTVIHRFWFRFSVKECCPHMSYTPPLSHGSHNNHLPRKRKFESEPTPQRFRCVHLDLLNVFGTKNIPQNGGLMVIYHGTKKKIPYCKQIQGFVSGRVSSKIPPLVHAASEMSHPINLNRAQPDSAQMRSISPRVKCVMQHKIPIYAERRKALQASVKENIWWCDQFISIVYPTIHNLSEF